ncbi:hypothetical protein E2C01_056780 [Portunus trituberculatus]|uniref:Uncharacterized protein n=1 Tax=Portunus trituberculatus TaxID=210409 RepID=A0A5B7GRA0_PORTR|nr:hypothetical protein [Portunus trituberculatus]
MTISSQSKQAIAITPRLSHQVLRRGTKTYGKQYKIAVKFGESQRRPTASPGQHAPWQVEAATPIAHRNTPRAARP